MLLYRWKVDQAVCVCVCVCVCQYVCRYVSVCVCACVIVLCQLVSWYLCIVVFVCVCVLWYIVSVGFLISMSNCLCVCICRYTCVSLCVCVKFCSKNQPKMYINIDVSIAKVKKTRRRNSQRITFWCKKEKFSIIHPFFIEDLQLLKGANTDLFDPKRSKRSVLQIKSVKVS